MYGDFFMEFDQAQKNRHCLPVFLCLSSKLFSTCKYASIADSTIGDRIVNAQ